MRIVLDLRDFEFIEGEEQRIIGQTVEFDFDQNVLLVKSLRNEGEVPISLDYIETYEPRVINKGEIVDIHVIFVVEKSMLVANQVDIVNGAILTEENFDILQKMTNIEKI